MARRYRDLYPEVASFENLWYAYKAAAKGKRATREVVRFEYHVEERLLELERGLADRSYSPGAYRSFYIRDPKRRLISAAPFRDRVVHHALCQVTEPLFERTFIGDSYANRNGKGTHAALDRAQGLARSYRYCLQCDVRQYFPSIDHEILFSLLARKLDDPDLLWLCRRILAGGEGVLAGEYTQVFFPGDDLLAAARPRGLPIGNLTSQLWANLYLNELDQYVKRVLHCPAYVRYVDDFLLFADDKATLWAWKAAIRERLAALRLTLHEASSTVYPVATGIPFLGFRLYPERRLIKRRNANLFARRLRRGARACERGELDIGDLWTRVLGWEAHAAHGHTRGLRAALLGRTCIGPRQGAAASSAP
jgi:RNA-directed DNA polymerase